MSAETVGTCPCGCELIAQRTWNKATKDQRRTWLANDLRMLQGRGLCRGCYLSAHRAGAFPKRGAAVVVVEKERPCARCGIVTAADLCRDCEAVLDRDELALWIA